MKSMNIVFVAVLGTLALSMVSSTGQVLDLTGATVEGSLSGQTLFDSGTSANDGIISSWVVKSSAIDPSGYIFVYQLKNEGPDEVTGANFNNFGLSQYISSESYSNVVNGSLSGSITPTVTLNPNFTYDTITGGGAATFNGGLNTGAVSWFIAINTDITSFTTGYGLAQDNFQAHGEIYAPNFAVYGVPEPPSALMLLVGTACFYAILRGRRALGN
ncbi:MAG TPA: hypothetical protein VGY98_08315 [Verrucomicrobiae bacterium]|nr:hypothetical protein [Verrucomicrobiae bacterium]